MLIFLFLLNVFYVNAGEYVDENQGTPPNSPHGSRNGRKFSISQPLTKHHNEQFLPLHILPVPRNNRTSGSSLLCSKEGIPTLPPQSRDGVHLRRKSSQSLPPLLIPDQSTTDPCALLCRKRENQKLSSPSSDSCQYLQQALSQDLSCDSPPLSVRSVTPTSRNSSPRLFRELEKQDSIRDVTPRRERSSLSRRESPKNLLEMFQKFLSSAEEEEPFIFDSKEVDISDVCTLISREYENMNEIPETLNPAFHTFRFYFYTYMNKEKEEPGQAIEVELATPTQLENWLKSMLDKNKLKPTYEAVINQFWRMTIWPLLDDHMSQMNEQALHLIAQSMLFIAANHRTPKEQSALFEKAAAIYSDLASRNLFIEPQLWFKAVEMYLNIGREDQFFIWHSNLLNNIVSQVNDQSSLLHQRIAAHCYLALCERPEYEKNSRECFLNATQSFFKAKAYIECFKLMNVVKAKDDFQWIRDNYEDVKKHVFKIQKNKWDLSYLVTGLIGYALDHPDRSNLPSHINEWISKKPQAGKLRQWYEIIRTRPKEWLQEKKVKLFVFSTGSSGNQPNILTLTPLQFDEWLEKLLEVKPS